MIQQPSLFFFTDNSKHCNQITASVTLVDNVPGHGHGHLTLLQIINQRDDLQISENLNNKKSTKEGRLKDNSQGG